MGGCIVGSSSITTLSLFHFSLFPSSLLFLLLPLSSQCLPQCPIPPLSSMFSPSPSPSYYFSLSTTSSSLLLPHFCNLIMPNFSEETNRILRSFPRQAELGQSLETQVIVTQKDRFPSEQQIFCDAKRNIIQAASTDRARLPGYSSGLGSLDCRFSHRRFRDYWWCCMVRLSFLF